MKFLLVVLVVHFIAEVANKKRNMGKKAEGDERTSNVHHPAEFRLR